MYGGKSVCWKGSKIGLKTKVEYYDQHGREAKLNMTKFVEKLKKVREKKPMFDLLIKDIESRNLQIGYPVIQAMNDMAEFLSYEEIVEIFIVDKKVKQ